MNKNTKRFLHSSARKHVWLDQNARTVTWKYDDQNDCYIRAHEKSCFFFGRLGIALQRGKISKGMVLASDVTLSSSPDCSISYEVQKNSKLHQHGNYYITYTCGATGSSSKLSTDLEMCKAG